MRRSIFAAALILFTAFPGWSSDLEFIHARIYTAPNAPAIADGAILIRDGKIAAVGSAPSIKGSRTAHGATVYDCTGMTIAAGFWNSHVHILPPALLHAERSAPAAITSQLNDMFTRWGFTTVFDIASVLSNTNFIRREIAKGTVQGPRILTVGEPFWGPGGTPIYVRQYLADNHVVIPEMTTAQAAIAQVDRQVAQGADGIKIFAGSAEAHSILLMPADLARAVVGEAHRKGRLVFSHPSSIQGVELSLDAGADILAHVSTEEGRWQPALLERMKAAGISLIPTLTLFDVESVKAGASLKSKQDLIDLAVNQLRAYASAGGNILFGTDIGYTDHTDTTEEFELMSRAGMSFPQILASLTTAPALRFGYASHSGRIAPGYDADLVVLQSDPAIDITALSKVAYTVRAGAVIFSAPLKAGTHLAE